MEKKETGFEYNAVKEVDTQPKEKEKWQFKKDKFLVKNGVRSSSFCEGVLIQRWGGRKDGHKKL